MEHTTAGGAQYLRVVPLTLASLHCYPIKSLGGFCVNETQLTDRGLMHDRRWMLVDDNGLFMSQREVGVMACLHTSALPDGFRVTDIRDDATLDLPWRIKIQLPAIENPLQKADEIRGADTDSRGGILTWNLTRTPMKK